MNSQQLNLKLRAMRAQRLAQEQTAKQNALQYARLEVLRKAKFFKEQPCTSSSRSAV